MLWVGASNRCILERVAVVALFTIGLLALSATASYVTQSCATTSVSSSGGYFLWTGCNSAATTITISAAAGVSFASCTFAGVTHPNAMNSYSLIISGGVFTGSGNAIRFSSSVSSLGLSILSGATITSTSWIDTILFSAAVTNIAISISSSTVKSNSGDALFRFSGISGTSNSFVISSSTISTAYQGWYNSGTTSSMAFSISGGSMFTTYYGIYFDNAVSSSTFVFSSVSVTSSTADVFRINSGACSSCSITFLNSNVYAPQSNYKSVFRQHAAAYSGTMLVSGSNLYGIYPLSFYSLSGLTLSITGSYIDGSTTGWALGMGDTGTTSTSFTMSVVSSTLYGYSAVRCYGTYSGTVSIYGSASSFQGYVTTFNFGSLVSAASVTTALTSATLTVISSVGECFYFSGSIAGSLLISSSSSTWTCNKVVYVPSSTTTTALTMSMISTTLSASGALFHIGGGWNGGSLNAVMSSSTITTFRIFRPASGGATSVSITISSSSYTSTGDLIQLAGSGTGMTLVITGSSGSRSTVSAAGHVIDDISTSSATVTSLAVRIAYTTLSIGSNAILGGSSTLTYSMPTISVGSSSTISGCAALCSNAISSGSMTFDSSSFISASKAIFTFSSTAFLTSTTLTFSTSTFTGVSIVGGQIQGGCSNCGVTFTNCAMTITTSSTDIRVVSMTGTYTGMTILLSSVSLSYSISSSGGYARLLYAASGTLSGATVRLIGNTMSSTSTVSHTAVPVGFASVTMTAASSLTVAKPVFSLSSSITNYALFQDTSSTITSSSLSFQCVSLSTVYMPMVTTNVIAASTILLESIAIFQAQSTSVVSIGSSSSTSVTLTARRCHLHVPVILKPSSTSSVSSILVACSKSSHTYTLGAGSFLSGLQSVVSSTTCSAAAYSSCFTTLTGTETQSSSLSVEETKSESGTEAHSRSASSSMEPSASTSDSTIASSSLSTSRSLERSSSQTRSLERSSSLTDSLERSSSQTRSLERSSSLTHSLERSSSLTHSRKSPTLSTSRSLNTRSRSSTPSATNDGSISPTISVEATYTTTRPSGSRSSSRTATASRHSKTFSITTHRSRSVSGSHTRSLSPVIPVEMGYRLLWGSTYSATESYYVEAGLPVLLVSPPPPSATPVVASLTLLPREADGSSVSSGYFRHPQPTPSSVTLGLLSSVRTPESCSGLPCTFSIDWASIQPNSDTVANSQSSGNWSLVYAGMEPTVIQVTYNGYPALEKRVVVTTNRSAVSAALQIESSVPRITTTANEVFAPLGLPVSNSRVLLLDANGDAALPSVPSIAATLRVVHATSGTTTLSLSLATTAAILQEPLEMLTLPDAGRYDASIVLSTGESVSFVVNSSVCLLGNPSRSAVVITRGDSTRTAMLGFSLPALPDAFQTYCYWSRFNVSTTPFCLTPCSTYCLPPNASASTVELRSVSAGAVVGSGYCPGNASVPIFGPVSVVDRNESVTSSPSPALNASVLTACAAIPLLEGDGSGSVIPDLGAYRVIVSGTTVLAARQSTGASAVVGRVTTSVLTNRVIVCAWNVTASESGRATFPPSSNLTITIQTLSVAGVLGNQTPFSVTLAVVSFNVTTFGDVSCLNTRTLLVADPAPPSMITSIFRLQGTMPLSFATNQSIVAVVNSSGRASSGFLCMLQGSDVGGKSVFYGSIRTGCTPAISGVSSAVSLPIVVYRPDGLMESTTFTVLPDLVPIITALAGCPLAAFPSVGACPSNGSVPLTITGRGFLSFAGTFVVGWSFARSGQTILCASNITISDTVLVCTAYPGFGSNGTAVVLEPGTLRVLSSSSATLSFSADGVVSCPSDPITGLTCSGHGTCNFFSGVCTCTASVDNGFWAGASCAACALYYNTSIGCAQRCPVDDNGVICGGLGYCNYGQCWCNNRWTSDICKSCPGVQSACSGHGTCDPVAGTCTCFQDSTRGYYNNSACSSCSLGFSGASCTISCPVDASGAVCSNNGACSNGVCYCIPAFCGLLCDLDRSTTSCSDCSVPSQYGSDCSRICPGSSQDPQKPCSGHGTCDSGQTGTGVCRCQTGYGSADCSVACPTAGGVLCAGHGQCNAFSGQCDCERFYATPSCAIPCPSDVGLPCAGHGTCNDGSGGNGRCLCDAGFGGPHCNVTCLGDLPCSGHGVCGGAGACICNADSARGFWSGSACEVCALGYTGGGCTVACPHDARGNLCSGHGTCTSAGTCTCFATTALGFWTGTACSDCSFGYYGASCTQECPGGSCNPCSGNGVCSDGVTGTGLCQCLQTYASGYWDGSDCSTCTADYFGSHCTSRCPSLRGITCPNGVCDHSPTGAGLCICKFGFAKDASGFCLECAPNFFGPSCTPCPATTANGTCNGRGACSDGIRGSGICTCFDQTGGAACDSNCPSTALGVPCGKGTCTSTGCVCDTNYAPHPATGLCDDCVRGKYGPTCTLTCQPCLFGTCDRVTGQCTCLAGYWGRTCDSQCPGGANNSCSGHGVCNVTTGTCSCYSSALLGFYVGEICQNCSAAFMSTDCRTRCPVVGGSICSGRGTCFNGRCSDCAPAPSEYGFIGFVCGAFCDLTDSQCFASSCPMGYWGLTCDSLCPGATVDNVSTTCTGNGKCDILGVCHCVGGYFGDQCQSSCPASNVTGSLRICSARGTCRSGTCVCLTGYGGPACEIECPGGASTPCNNRGQCFDGVCKCQLGAVGLACEALCPGGLASPCSWNGVCTATGNCLCNNDAITGYFTGAACDTCQGLYTGRSCNIPCLPNRGTIDPIARTCTCFDGFTGIGCSESCTKALDGTFCSGHGSCVGQERCQCETNYYGPTCNTFCTIALCQDMGLYRPQCNVSTGKCECRSASIGRWVGETCSDCAASSWGDECNLLCACNNHGTCHRITGLCNCYADATNGFWTGTACGSCLAGYFGPGCLTLNVQITPPVQPTVSNRNGTAPPVRGWLLFDPVTSYAVQGNSQSNVVNLLEARSTGAVSALASLHALSPTVSGLIFNATHYLIVTLGGGRVFLPRNPSSLLGLTALPMPSRRHGFQALASTVLTSAPFFLVAGGVLCELDWAGSAPNMLTCNGTTFATFTGANAMLAANFVGTTVDSNTVVVVGPASSGSAQWTLVAVNVTSRSVHSLTSGLLHQGEVLQCIGIDAVAVVCMVYDRSLKQISLKRMDVSGMSVTISRLVTAATLNCNATAMGLDTAFDTAFIAYNFELQPSTVLTFQASTLLSIGKYSLGGLYVVTSLAIDSTRRLLLGTMEDSFTLAFLSLNLFGIRSVSPNVVDLAGGVLLTVVGTGFDISAANDTWCLVSGVPIPGILVDTTTILCVAPASHDALTACAHDTLDVRFGTRSTSQTTVGLTRPVSAVLTGVFTNYGTDAYGGYDIPTTLSLVGFGFVASNFARCRLVNASGYVFFDGPARYVNSTAAECDLPAPLPPSSSWTGIQYSHDGTRFGASTTKYTVVGPTVALVAQQSRSVVIAAQSSSVGTITVFSADAFGNRRRVLEQRRDFIRCSSLVPELAITGAAELQNYTTGSQVVVSLSSGAAVFDNINLLLPQATPFSLYCFSTGDITMASALSFQVVPGAPYAIAVATSSQWRVGVLAERELVPKPFAWVQDRANNRITAVWALPYSMQISAPRKYNDPHQLSPRTNITTSIFTAVPDGTTGLYMFDHVILQSTFDDVTVMTFTASGLPGVAITVPQETCIPDAQFAVRHTFDCGACPVAAICDGSSRINTRPGFWRGNGQTLNFFTCHPPEACPSASQCAEGYQGRICATCEPGYGRSLSGCEKCWPAPINWVANAVAFVVVVLVVLQGSLLSMPYSSAKEFEVRRRMQLIKIEKVNAVVIKLLQSHAQMLTSIPYGQIPLPLWMQSLFATSQTGSAANPSNIVFIACSVASSVWGQLKLTLLLIPGITCSLAVIAGFLAWRQSHVYIQEEAELAAKKLKASGAFNGKDGKDATEEYLDEKRKARERRKISTFVGGHKGAHRTHKAVEIFDADDEGKRARHSEEEGEDNKKGGAAVGRGKNAARDALLRRHAEANLATPDARKHQQEEEDGGNLSQEAIHEKTKEKGNLTNDTFRQMRSIDVLALEVTADIQKQLGADGDPQEFEDPDDNATPLISESSDSSPINTKKTRKLVDKTREGLVAYRADLLHEPSAVQSFLHSLHLASLLNRERRVGEFVSRWFNMLLVAFVGVLFQLYPTLVQYACTLLRCELMDLPDGSTVHVLASDPEVLCYSAHGTAIRAVAALTFAGCMFAIPVILYYLVIVLSRTTCRHSARERKDREVNRQNAVDNLTAIEGTTTSENLEQQVENLLAVAAAAATGRAANAWSTAASIASLEESVRKDVERLEAQWRSEIQQKMTELWATAEPAEKSELLAARNLFFFTTGRYRDECWWWESVSLTKKLGLVLINQMLPELWMRLLVSMWVMMASLAINLYYQPWDDRTIEFTEDVSMAVLALTFGLLGMLFFPVVKESPVAQGFIVSGVVILNVVVVLVLTRIVWRTWRSADGLVKKVLEFLHDSIAWFQRLWLIQEKKSTNLKYLRKQLSRFRITKYMMVDGEDLIATAVRLIRTEETVRRSSVAQQQQQEPQQDNAGGFARVLRGEDLVWDDAEAILSRMAQIHINTDGTKAQGPEGSSAGPPTPAAAVADHAAGSPLTASQNVFAHTAHLLASGAAAAREQVPVTPTAAPRTPLPEVRSSDSPITPKLSWLTTEDLIPEFYNSFAVLRAIEAQLTMDPLPRWRAPRFLRNISRALNKVFSERNHTRVESITPLPPDEGEAEAGGGGGREAVAVRLQLPHDDPCGDCEYAGDGASLNGDHAPTLSERTHSDRVDFLGVWLAHYYKAEQRFIRAFYRLHRSVHLLNGTIAPARAMSVDVEVPAVSQKPQTAEKQLPTNHSRPLHTPRTQMQAAEAAQRNEEEMQQPEAARETEHRKSNALPQKITARRKRSMTQVMADKGL